LTSVGWITALYNKAFDTAVKDRIVVLATCSKGEKVFTGLGTKLAVKLNLNVAMGCYQSE
jgi:hypothetical protein